MALGVKIGGNVFLYSPENGSLRWPLVLYLDRDHRIGCGGSECNRFKGIENLTFCVFPFKLVLLTHPYIPPNKKETTLMPNTFYINYFGPIDERTTNVIMETCASIMTQNQPDCLYFLFASNGGSVNAGISLYNFIKALPTKIVMHNTGRINSIANVIFLAGEERYAVLHSSFLFHGVTWSFNGGANLNLSQIIEAKSGIENDQEKIAGIISGNTSITKNEILELFAQGETKGSDFAQEKGIIQGIKDPQVPKGAPFVSININLK